MAFTILICDPIHPDAISWLESQADIQLIAQPGISPEVLTEAIDGVDAIIVRGRTKVGPDVIERASRLKVIGRAGSGLDNIDQRAAGAAGVRILNVPGANAAAVAELTLGLMIALARELPHTMATTEKPKSYGWELGGKTLGIVGLGRIGSRVARLTHSLDMKILANDNDVNARENVAGIEGIRWTDLVALLQESDVISLHVPLSDETRHLIDEEELEAVKGGAVLVNTARAEVVNEAAVLGSLDRGTLAGYAADLCLDGRLVRHPRAVITPHIGAQTQESQRRAGLEIAHQVASTLREASGVEPNRDSHSGTATEPRSSKSPKSSNRTVFG